MRNCLSFLRALFCYLAPLSALGAGLSASSVVRVDARSGRLVRRVVAPSLRRHPGSGDQTVGSLRGAARVDELVAEAARKHGIDPLLIHSVIEVESGYNPFAVSPRGAEGLMQLLPVTARRLGVANSFDPGANIDAGVRHLKYLQAVFRNDELALAAYNAGEGAVQRHGWIPPYRETRQYVERVGRRYAELAKGREPSRELPAGERGYRPIEFFIDGEGRLHIRTR
jgi:hypothetical protein